MAKSWTIDSALERLKAELDSTVQFWLQHSHDKECGSVFAFTCTIFSRSRDLHNLQWISALSFTRG